MLNIKHRWCNLNILRLSHISLKDSLHNSCKHKLIQLQVLEHRCRQKTQFKSHTDYLRYNNGKFRPNRTCQDSQLHQCSVVEGNSQNHKYWLDYLNTLGSILDQCTRLLNHMWLHLGNHCRFSRLCKLQKRHRNNLFLLSCQFYKFLRSYVKKDILC